MFILKEGTSGGTDTPADTRLEIIKWLGLEGMVVRTKDQDTQAIQTAINEANGNRKVTATIKEITGIAPETNETEEAYIKRATGKKFEEITALKAKIQEFETKGVEGSAIATEYKQRIDVLTKELSDKTKEYNDQVTTLKAANFQARVDNEINNIVSTLNLRKMHDDDAINKTLLQRLRDSTVMQFKTEFTAVESSDTPGLIVFKDKGGKIVRKTEDGSPQALNAIIQPYFDPLIDKEHKAVGAGSGKDKNPTDPPPGGKKDWSKVTLPDTIKAQTQLYAWLKTDQKMDENSKEFTEAFAHFKQAGNLPPTPKQ